MIDLNQNIQYIKGVGPSKLKILNKLGIYNVEDIITYFPREYEDRSNYKKIKELVIGEENTFKAIVFSKVTENKIRKGMTIYRLIARDETGSIMLVWYNQTYLKNKFKMGQEYTFHGKVVLGYKGLEVQSPVFDEENQMKNTGKIIPIYPLTSGITQNMIRNIIENALKLSNNQLEEILPEVIRTENKLCEINYAINNIHFPMKKEDFEKARYRIAFEELLILQLGLLNMKNSALKELNGIEFDKNIIVNDLINILPYTLTNAQIRVWQEIENDMNSNKVMNRLVQGDVGSGKTVVATLAMYKAVKSGYQAAIMVPTSILAMQHYEGISKMLEPLGVKCALFTGNLTKKQKEILLNKLKEGEINIVVGTHALIEENVEFNNLGIVVTDEQHRFGVRQRKILSSKGENADILVMTATPIPRTLALILYGDLDISIIDELPPGRQKIETYAVTKDMEERINNFIKKELKEGRQAYIVCPLVDDSEELNLKSVKTMYEHYKEILSDYTLEFLHGKMKPREKDDIMLRYKKGEIQILVSTTVIEVGVDVPNATMMIIENAERFGLAQLHQLRGRVGRGKYKSYCILKYEGKSHIVKQRMNIMQKSNDGFAISEKDLELRGPGEFFGTRQHGIPEFKVVNLFKDMQILKKVQIVANNLLKDDPKLNKLENLKLKDKINDIFNKFTT